MPKHKHADINNDIEKVGDALAKVAEDVRGKAENLLNESISNAKSKTINLEKTARDYMVKHPLKTLACSIFAGMLLSKFLRK